MGTSTQFQEAVLRRDIPAMVSSLAADVHLFNPVGDDPLVGRDAARPVFEALQAIFEDFTYTHQLDGHGVSDHGATTSRCLAFRCRVGDQPVEGVDLLDFDEHGLIARFTVMIRPLDGLHALMGATAGPTPPRHT